MEQAKRKTVTSSEVKRRYNKKVYSCISANIPKDMAEAFRKKCVEKNISQAQIIKDAIDRFLSEN